MQGGLECIRNVLYAVLARCAVDGYNIELRLMVNVVRFDIYHGCANQSERFAAVDGFNGVFIRVAACLDFDKNNPRTFECNNIEFIMAGTPIAFGNGVSYGGEIGDCDLFTPLSGVIMLCHNSLMVGIGVLLNVLPASFG